MEAIKLTLMESIMMGMPMKFTHIKVIKVIMDTHIIAAMISIVSTVNMRESATKKPRSITKKLINLAKSIRRESIISAVRRVRGVKRESIIRKGRRERRAKKARSTAGEGVDRLHRMSEPFGFTERTRLTP